MAGKKQILVVDDHFEILDLLRSMLEQTSPDYQVLGVPSAEEGFLEMRRTPFDLLITDVRLPGMSGFELVRKVRQFAPDTPIIMITAYSTTQGKQEAEELGVSRYFEKPLDTDALLAAVYTLLYPNQPAITRAAEPLHAQGSAMKASPKVRDDVRARLRTLRQDTGAAQIVLARSDGDILAQVGELAAIDIEQLTQLVALGLENSFQLAEQLQSSEPLTIQYQAGDKVDLYTANIGRDYFLMLLFDVLARRGRIGTVWIFAQRAIKELKGMLPVPASVGAMTPDVEHESREASQPLAGEITQAEDNKPQDAHPASTDTEDRSAVAEDLEEEADLGEALAAADAGMTNEAVTDAEEPELPEVDIAALAEALGGVEPATELDLDAFWDEATGDNAQGAAGGDGLSFEEAMKRGLLPPAFGDEGQ